MDDFKRMLEYSEALDLHNDRNWFHENHKWYEGAKKDFQELLEILRFAIADAAPAISDDIMYMGVKDWMYRTARDMRYSKNRPPYDPAFRAYISRDKKSWLPIGYYLRIMPGSSCFGTGLWCENTADINRVRDYIMFHYEELDEICKENQLEITGDKLKKMPRGYDETHPAAEWLKYKNWMTLADVPDAKLDNFEDYAKLIGKTIKKMEPFRQFMLTASTGEKSQKEIFDDFYKMC